MLFFVSFNKSFRFFKVKYIYENHQTETTPKKKPITGKTKVIFNLYNSFISQLKF